MSDAMIRLSIDSREVEVKQGTSLLDACVGAGAKVPTLCYLEGLAPSASCGLCVVEVEGAKSLSRACATMAAPGMKVATSSGRVMRARRIALELLLANHPADCLSCARNGSCELQGAAELMGIRERRFPRTRISHGLDESAEGLVRDNDKCILCGRCIAVCQEVQGGVGYRLCRARRPDPCGHLHGPGGSRSPPASSAASARSSAPPERSPSATTPGPSGASSATARERSSSRPRRRYGLPSARRSAWRRAASSRARWRRPSAAWASPRSSTRSSRPTSPSWRREASFSSAYRAALSSP